MFMCGDVSVYVWRCECLCVEMGVFMWKWECLCGSGSVYVGDVSMYMCR